MTTKIEPVLRQPKECIKSLEVISAPRSCPYENYFIQIVYTNGETQVMTHNLPTANIFGTHEFDDFSDLLAYYNSLK